MLLTLLLLSMVGIIVIYMYYNISNISDLKVKVITLTVSIFASTFKYFTLARLTAAFISLGLILLLRYTIAGGFHTNPLNIEEGLKIGIPAIILKIGIQGIIDYIFEDLGLRVWIENLWNGPRDNGKLVIGYNSSFECEAIKKPTDYQHLAAQSDNGGEGPSSYKDNVGEDSSSDIDCNSLSSSPSPTTTNPRSRMRFYMNKFDRLKAEYDEIDSDDSVDSILAFEGDRKRTKPNVKTKEVNLEPHGLERNKTKLELVEDVKGLQQIAVDRRRIAVEYDKDLETYRGAMKAIKKDVEDRTTKDFEYIERLTNKGWLFPTSEALKLNYRHTSMLKTRALDKANLAMDKALAAIKLHGLSNIMFKPNASSAVIESTEVNKLKNKFNADDDSDNNKPKRTKVSISNNEKK